MKTRFRSSNFSNVGFTLIELLVVISIIAILAAMLLPAINVAKRKGAETTARADMQNISLAIGRYESDYNGRFPAPGVQTGTSDVTYGYTAGTPIPNLTAITTNSGVIAILLDLEKFNNGVATANVGHVLNPRRISNLNAKYTSDTNSGGIGPDGEYRDPWGNPYVISMDTSLDDRCLDQLYSRKVVSQDSGQKGNFGLFNPDVATKADQFRFNGKFLIWSLGADGKASTTKSGKIDENKDNLLSWQ